MKSKIWILWRPLVWMRRYVFEQVVMSMALFSLCSYVPNIPFLPSATSASNLLLASSIDWPSVGERVNPERTIVRQNLASGWSKQNHVSTSLIASSSSMASALFVTWLLDRNIEIELLELIASTYLYKRSTPLVLVLVVVFLFRSNSDFG